VARGLRERCGPGFAWIEQDHLRRVRPGERGRPGAATIGLIDQTVRYALDAAFHVVREGIRFTDHCAQMLRGLRRPPWRDVRLLPRRRVRRDGSPGCAAPAGRPVHAREQMRGWLDPDDRPAITGETVIPASSS